MDAETQLRLVTAVLILVCVVWASREFLLRRRRRAEAEIEDREASSELMPLLVQSATSLVKHLMRDKSSIESLVGPDGTVTLLFCDIEGSTQINRRLGDEEWARVLRTHDDLVDRLVRRNGGKVVKTQGDGFMAAFPRPGGAVSAAIAFGPWLHESDELAVPMSVRVGVHTGQRRSAKGRSLRYERDYGSSDRGCGWR